MTTTKTKQIDIIQNHSATPPGMHFYASLESVLQDDTILSYFSVIKRAWREMKLDGVLCLDGRPVLYLKSYARPFTNQERLFQQRLFWNQGVANILVLADPTTVYIYSGLARPARDDLDQAAAEEALVQTIPMVDYVNQIQSLYHALATGHYYEKHQAHFDPDQAVDMRLLNNLRILREALTQGTEKLNIQNAHALIGRVLFLCYLLDREIFSVEPSKGSRTGTVVFTELMEKLTDKERIDYLYEIFWDLKEKFNGNMFDQDLDAEKHLIKPSHLNKLMLFLGGHDVKSGQLSFWPYDFKMIPVETISAIYQDFLSAEDPGTQRKRGAFYTPRFLAEMVVDMALGDDPDTLEGAFLDPACGSGIFLVILFNRFANRWLLLNRRAHYSTKVTAFQKILSRQIHGVDIEETACRIACFSLYLAYLDFFDPPDIKDHIEKTGRPLPKLLDYGKVADRPAADIAVIYKADFLEDKAFSDQAFDCIIGNPPWEGRGSKQLAQKFMQKAPKILRDGGVGCLLLPTKILQNQTDAFQSKWLSQVSLEKVLQLADYSFLLFQNALCPAFIARFTNTPPQPDRHMVNFNAPKFNRDGLRQGVIKVDPSSRTWIPLHEILSATRSKTAPVAWKRRLWGTARDQKLLDLLQSLPPLKQLVDVHSELQRQKIKRTKRWVAGEGIKPWPIDKKKSDRSPKTLRWSLSIPFIETRPWNSDLILFPNETISLGERLKKKNYKTDVLYSQPPADLFCGPMVLFSRGFKKIAFCDFDVVFQHSLRSISGPKKDSNLLIFLAAYLRSNLARYFLFHTSASWGIERDQVHFGEVLNAPFPLPGNRYISHDSEHIVQLVADKFKTLQKNLKNRLFELKKRVDRNLFSEEAERQVMSTWRQEKSVLTNRLQAEYEPFIYQYFGLTDQEIAIVEDTNDIFISSSTPTTRYSSKAVTLDPLEKSKTSPYKEKRLGAYAHILTKTLNAWAEAEGSNHRATAEGGTDENTGLAMVTVSLSSKEAPYNNKSVSKELFNVLKTFKVRLSKKRGALHYERDIFFFQGDNIHIIRPNILLNWTRTAALNDAARIYGDIAIANKES